MDFSIPDEVVRLRSQVDYLLELLADKPALTNSPVNWRDLNTDDAAEQWGRLVPWVDWLRDRYTLTDRIPACWYEHGPLVEELSALRCFWIATFLDKDAPAGSAVAFHDALDRLLLRFRRWDRSGCSDGRHRPEPPAFDTTDYPQRERTVHADLARRKP